MLITENKLRAMIAEEYRNLMKEYEVVEVIRKGRDGIYYVYETNDEHESTKMGAATTDDFHRLGYPIPADFDEASNYEPPRRKSYGYKRRFR